MGAHPTPATKKLDFNTLILLLFNEQKKLNSFFCFFGENNMKENIIGREYLVHVRDSFVVNPNDPQSAEILETYPIKVVGVMGDQVKVVEQGSHPRVYELPIKLLRRGICRGSIITITPIPDLGQRNNQ